VSGRTEIWLDGDPVSALPLPDRGLDYGDGLFETLLLRAGHPLFLQLHLQRLQRGLGVLGFPSTILARLEACLFRSTAAVVEGGWQWASMRITITRGTGPRGYAPPEDPQPRILISASELGSNPMEMPAPAVLGTATIRWCVQPALAGIKHLNRLEQVLAARECRQSGYDEAVMLNQAGQLVSVTSGNLFLVRDGQILTAALDQCGIAGTRRSLVMERWAPALRLQVCETQLEPCQLEQADEAFFSNSLTGVRPVASFNSRRWSSHPVCDAMHAQYQQALS
jgi:4-amino-4-deoxychorismate lyase